MYDYNEPVRIRRALTFLKSVNHHRTISKKFLGIFQPLVGNFKVLLHTTRIGTQDNGIRREAPNTIPRIRQERTF